ncbi:MAG: hypothetical protein HC921_21595 [Synechococcaceae cyanobacterium SM2_3_1]|nr:hypothetical protein [Synechococcaceae cyanobacterium SM2_3_1]
MIALVGGRFIGTNVMALSSSNNVYLYDNSNGNSIRTITIPGGNSGRQSVVLDVFDQLLLVGRTTRNTTGNSYLFNTSTGSLLRTYTNPSSSLSNMFSGSVAVSNQYIVIGAPGEDNDRGSVHIYTDDSNSRLYEIQGPGAEGGYFGTSVAIDGSLLIVGASGEGKSYVYQLP